MIDITEEFLGISGVKYIVEYSDCDDFSVLPYEECRQVYGVCFSGDDIVIGYNGKKDTWGLIGGTIEKGESFEEAFAREIQEESNMEVLVKVPVGYQKMIDTRDGSFVYQLRYMATVRPFGPFVSDPAESVIEIKLVDPLAHREYFNWGKIGDRIIERALELKKGLS